MKSIFLVSVFMLCSSIFAQEIQYKLIFKDSKSGEAVQQVFIKNDSVYYSPTDKSNQHGELLFGVSVLNHPFELQFQHPLYETKKVSFSLKKGAQAGDLIEKTIYLVWKNVQEQQEVVAAAPGIPQVYFASEKYSVSDFELLPNAEVLLLVYPKTLKKGSELMLVQNSKIIKQFNLEENAKELIRDYRGKVHAICENGIFGISRSKNEIGISTIDKAYFMRYVFPVVDTIESKMYFSNYSEKYPAFEYFYMDKKDSVYGSLLEIKDDLMMELYRSEYKWMDIRTKLWAKNLELETGIDKEIWVGANYFTQSIYYESLYAPMFERNDSIFVFDYYKDVLFYFDSDGKKLDSVPIYHHYQAKKTGWQKNIIQDSETGELFAHYEINGRTLLKRIDVNTGKLEETIELQHKYVTKIALQGNLIYYIYRPFESAQKKYLYYTKMPFDFKSNATTQGSLISIETGK